MSALMEAVEKLEQAVGAVDKANCPTHTDCANWKPGQGICIEWQRPINPNTPVCSRFLPAVGPRREHLDFKVMLSREIPPRKKIEIPRPKPTMVKGNGGGDGKKGELHMGKEKQLAPEAVDKILQLLIEERIDELQAQMEAKIRTLANAIESDKNAVEQLRSDYSDLHNFVERNDAKMQNQLDVLAGQIARLREDVDKLLAADARLSARILSLLEIQMGLVRKAGAA